MKPIDSNVVVLNKSLQEAKIHIRVLKLNTDGSIVTLVDKAKQTFDSISSLFEYANGLAKLEKRKSPVFFELPSTHSNKAPMASKNVDDASDLILVDKNGDATPDFILHYTLKGWEMINQKGFALPNDFENYRNLLRACFKSPKANQIVTSALKSKKPRIETIKALAEISWKDLGIPETKAGDFKQETYAFDQIEAEHKTSVFKSARCDKTRCPWKNPTHSSSLA